MIVRRRDFLIGAAACALAGPARAELPVPAGDQLKFDVMRHGGKIGYHNLTFERQGDRLTVQVDVAIKVGFGPITFFRYTHQNTETWAGDQLTGFVSKTYDNGDHLSASARLDGDRLLVEGTKARPYDAPLGTLAATHWNKKQLDGPMINTETGVLIHPTITSGGPVMKPQADGKEISVTVCALTGDVTLDLWYDAVPSWAGLNFKASDGSDVIYQRA